MRQKKIKFAIYVPQYIFYSNNKYGTSVFSYIARIFGTFQAMFFFIEVS